jgi:DedD protein
VNTRYENDLYESAEQDREISLSTTSILGIFFALALLCAVFFGFGYSMGRKSAQPASRPLDSSSTADEDNPPASTPIKAVVTSARSERPAEATPKPAGKPAGIIPVAAAQTSAGSSVVQVAAMSHQEDADVVAVDLKRRGYTVAVRHEPQDKLFHVQIGPFATKKEADAMRQRLQTDGYNSAIVK